MYKRKKSNERDEGAASLIVWLKHATPIIGLNGLWREKKKSKVKNKLNCVSAWSGVCVWLLSSMWVYSAAFAKGYPKYINTEMGSGNDGQAS